MREAKQAWVLALRQLEGCGDADIRWNTEVARWEFVLRGADGIPRSQFWGVYKDYRGRPLKPDPVTGLYPFRDLDDGAMREAIQNLEQTYVANRWDGTGSTQKEVLARYRFNQTHLQRQYRAAGEAFADMAAERGKRLRGALQVSVPATLTK